MNFLHVLYVLNLNCKNDSLEKFLSLNMNQSREKSTIRSENYCSLLQFYDRPFSSLKKNATSQKCPGIFALLKTSAILRGSTHTHSIRGLKFLPISMPKSQCFKMKKMSYKTIFLKYCKCNRIFLRGSIKYACNWSCRPAQASSYAGIDFAGCALSYLVIRSPKNYATFLNYSILKAAK